MKQRKNNKIYTKVSRVLATFVSYTCRTNSRQSSATVAKRQPSKNSHDDTSIVNNLSEP